MTRCNARITALRAYVPEKRLTNAELESMVDTNHEWIVQRTGIKERRIAGEDEFTSDLCVQAVYDLMDKSKKDIHDVDLIIVSTMTPDFYTPSVASLVQAKLGIKRAGSFDLNAACAGFTYGLHLANGLIATGLHQKILVIGGETLSKITDYSDRSTCILFGDGAGAVLVEYNEKDHSFISAHLGSEGERAQHLYCPNLSNQMNGTKLQDRPFIVQNGREVYKWAVNTVTRGISEVLSNSRTEMEKVDWFVPHSANMRMIESICEKSGFPFSKTLSSLEYYGNTSSATIPLALHQAMQNGQLKSQDMLLLYGFGGGLAHCGQLVEWTI